MTDAKNKEDELVLDWTDELATWELDVDDHAKAESSPLPDNDRDTARGMNAVQHGHALPAPGSPDNDGGPTETASFAPRKGPPPPPAAALHTVII